VGQAGSQYAFAPDHFAHEVTVAPVSEPITTAEAKEHLRVDHSNDDTYIDSAIATARRLVESRTGKALLTQTHRMMFDGFPRRVFESFSRVTHDIKLLSPPLQSISSIQYIDTDGATQTLSASIYTVDTASKPGRVLPAFGETWPIVQSGVPNSVIIEYVCGYASASAVPEDIRHAVKFIVSHLYENREHVVIGTIASVLADTLDALLSDHIRDFMV